MGDELASSNVNRSYSLAATSIAIFTFMLIFLYPRFASGEINALLFQVTLVVMSVATFSFVFASFFYYGSSPTVCLLWKRCPSSPSWWTYSLTAACRTTITNPGLRLRTRRVGMKIVVIGSTGLIGSKTLGILRQRGHEGVAASPNTGVNTITGEGLKEAMAGTQVVIDLANSPSFEDKAVLEFFETSGHNLHAAEAAAGVRHHVALSIVGTDRTPENGYFRAKVAQEKLIETSDRPRGLSGQRGSHD